MYPNCEAAIAEEKLMGPALYSEAVDGEAVIAVDSEAVDGEAVIEVDSDAAYSAVNGEAVIAVDSEAVNGEAVIEVDSDAAYGAVDSEAVNSEAAIAVDRKPVYPETVAVDCKNMDEFRKMCTFIDCMASNRSGSLKLYDEYKKKVKVRGWKESAKHYAQSGYPPIYELRLQNVECE